MFVAPPAGCLLVVALTALGADLVTGKGPLRAFFNAGQFCLCLATGAAVGNRVTDLLTLSRGQDLDLRWLLGGGLAMTVAFLLNSILISIVLALHQGVPLTEMFRRSLDVNLGMDGLLLALSPVFVVIGLHGIVLVPLLLVTVWIIFRSATIALSNRHEATHDQLTGIPNRRLFEDHAGLLLRGAKHSRATAALIHIDLDGFKGINDRLGHHYGDLVLRAVAERLSSHKRAVDHVARLGGDEFAVLLGQVNTAVEAKTIAQRLLSAIEVPMEVEGVPLAVSASLGVAMFPAHGEDLHTLLNHADIAMYKAKGQSTGVEVFSSTGSEGPSRMGLLADLSRAIDTGELCLHYQPRVSVATGAIVGVEALLRWSHPAFGEVDPSWFMPQAEQTELMTPLTDHVIEQAVSQCAMWLDRGIRVTVAVNASARNLHDLRFPNRVAEILRRHNVDPGWLEIEITENTVMSDPARSASVLGHLRAIGVSLAIDDFGTGYSSLANLRTLTIDRIKIDRSFVAGIDGSGGDLTIVRSIVELGKNLGLTTVAEGIESEEVLAIIHDLGCDEYQGFLASKALPAAELEPMLAAGTVALAPAP
jgi:diguanylate cyclase (GGDEF)-like protein